MSKSRDIADSAATINYIDGLTSDAQTQLDGKATLDASPTFTGTVTATAFSGDGSGLTGVDSLPSQTGNADKYLTTDGTTASWDDVAGGGMQSMQVFTSSGTWTRPAGITKIKVFVTAAGGSGGGTSAGYGSGSGGGGGGTSIKFIDVSAISSAAVTVGASAVRGQGANGSTGGSSSFGSYATATGGAGGQGSAIFNGFGGLGGIGSSGDINLRGSAGGGSNGSTSTGYGGTGGASYFGGGGTNGVSTSNAPDSSTSSYRNYGGGGGGSGSNNSANRDGQDSGQGIVIVEEYA